MTIDPADAARTLASLVYDEWGLGPAPSSGCLEDGVGWHPYDTTGADDRFQVETAISIGPLMVAVFLARRRRLVVMVQPRPELPARSVFTSLWRVMETITPQNVESLDEIIRVGEDVFLLLPTRSPDDSSVNFV